MLEVREHPSPKYPPRTWANAFNSDLTFAFALDFSTPGEELTRRCAGQRYMRVSLLEPAQEAGQLLAKWRVARFPHMRLNIAGNGMATLARYIWTQERVNNWVHTCLREIHAAEPITAIVTGGQTGVDLAAAVAAVQLEIPCVVTMPQGYLQRDVSGHDAAHTREAIIAQIMQGCAQLKEAA